MKIRYKKTASLILFAFFTITSLTINFNFFRIISIDNNHNKGNDYIQNNIKLQGVISQDEFLYYKNITIDHLKIGSSILINFPFLLDIYDKDLRDYAQTDGDDIAFFNGTIKLDHELIKFDYTYNNTHAHLITYIRIPELSNLTDTIIQMYFGNPSLESQENITGVWSSEYKGVWHLDEDPSDQIKDSSNYSNNGNTHDMNSDDLVSAIVNNGLNITGEGKYIDCGKDNSLDLLGTYATIEFWIYLPITSISKNYNIISKGSAYSIIERSTDFMVTIGGLGCQFPEAPTGTWSQIIITVNPSIIKTYVNGHLYSQYPHSRTITHNTYSLYISDPSNGGVSMLDEVRVSNTYRSSDWIKATYDNQKNPSSFCSLGQKIKTSTYEIKPRDFKYSRVITINHEKVNGTGYHKNFPVLINILDPYLHNYSQPDGRDIMFSNETNWLDFEVEYYNHSYLSTHAKLVAWVRIPFLSTSQDTNITMYFGNSSMISQQTPFDVWNSNYTGVWHLKENPSEVIKDSTQYHNDGITHGDMTSDDLIEGKIDGALNFDGINDYINVGNDSSLDFNYTDQATIEAWFLPKDNSLDQYLINKYDTWEPSYQIAFSGGKVKATGGVGTLESINSLSLDIWQHVTVVINGGGIEKLYINGIRDNMDDPSYLLWSQPNNDVIFGCGWNNQPSTSHFYNGSLDEIRISNVVRSAGWIATQYNNQFDPDTFYSYGILRSAPGAFILSTNTTSPDTDGIFTLNWTTSSGADNYSIYWDTNWISDYYEYLTLLDEGLTNNSIPVQFSNGTYYFVSISYNETGYTLSNCIEVIVRLLPGGFSITCNASNPDTDGVFQLNWTDSEWARNYSIYFYNSSFSEIYENVSLLAEGLTNNSLIIRFSRGIFYFRVVSINEVGNNISENEIMVYIYLPPDPFELTLDKPSVDAEGFIQITWTASAGALNYSLYLDNEYISSYHDNLTLIKDGITTNYYRFQLNHSGTYYFLVIAYNDVGNISSTCESISVFLSDNGGNDNNPLLYILIIVGIILGSIIVVSFTYSKYSKSSKFKDTRKEIPLKLVLNHIKKIFQSTSKTTDTDEIDIISKNDIIIEVEDKIDKNIVKLKQKVIELYLDGAYLESLREIKNIIKKFNESGKNKNVEFFQNLFDRINNLVKLRDNKITILEEAKLNNKTQDVLLLYNEIIQISKELNDTVSIEMYQFEMENYKNQNM